MEILFLLIPLSVALVLSASGGKSFVSSGARPGHSAIGCETAPHAAPANSRKTPSGQKKRLSFMGEVRGIETRSWLRTSHRFPTTAIRTLRTRAFARQPAESKDSPPCHAHAAPDCPTFGHSCSESSSAWVTPPAAPSARQSNTPISTKRRFSPETRDRAHPSAGPVRSRERQRVACFPARGRHFSFAHRNPNVRASRVASCSFVTLPW